jgi:hypothetical protein
MKTTRIELEGSAGHVTIERKRGDTKIRIDSVIREPKRTDEVWKTWEVEASIDDEALFKIAVEVQRRSEGKPGSNSMIHDYYREMQRFQD